MNIGSEMNCLSESSMVPFPTEALHIGIQSLDSNDVFADQESSAGWTLEQPAFYELLNWFDPDTETAGRHYELIRQKLITLFRYRACVFPDELADETINRVARKLPQIKHNYVGSPARYFYGVAKRVYLEYIRAKPVRKLLPTPVVEEDVEGLFQRLDYALSRLEQADRELVLSYYQGDGQSKIAHRKNLADQLGVNLSTLRTRIHRIRFQLRSYLELQK
jgi:DNA-directed RNA polymerase specialized sigma24 family protein